MVPAGSITHMGSSGCTRRCGAYEETNPHNLTMIDQAAQTYPYRKGCEEKTGLSSRAGLDDESLTESHNDSHAPAQEPTGSMPTSGNYFHLHLISDSTGETLITVARAVAAQYANVTPVEHVYPLVRSQKQLDRVLDEIEEAPGIVLFTLLEKDLVS